MGQETVKYCACGGGGGGRGTEQEGGRGRRMAGVGKRGAEAKEGGNTMGSSPVRGRREEDSFSCLRVHLLPDCGASVVFEGKPTRYADALEVLEDM